MQISFSLNNVLAILALILGVLSLVTPRLLHIFVAIFLIAYAVVGFGLLR